MSTTKKTATKCECGCGTNTSRVVLLLREQDRGTAETLDWRELSIGPMRVPVSVERGHEDGLEGYITREESGR